MSANTNDVPSWLANLPITDPRCANESCIAFQNAEAASQAKVSWGSQFHYGWFVCWIYAGILGVFIAIHLLHRIAEVRVPPHLITEPGDRKIGLLKKLKALTRIFSYRRVPGKIGSFLGLPSFGVLFIILVATVASTAMVFAQGYYYRERRGYGSPPIGVRAGLMSAALIPLLVALSGKVSLNSPSLRLIHLYSKLTILVV